MSIIPVNPEPSAIIQAGHAANYAASQGVFADYRTRRAPNTLRAQDAALERFTVFLSSIGANPAGDLSADPAAWHGITWGLVEAFRQHMLTEGYAIASINLNVTILKVYAKLASKAGTLDKLEYLQIRDVTTYSRKDAKHINIQRETAALPTRRPADVNGKRQATKKSEHTSLTRDDARHLKHDASNTPQGRRDAVLMSLLLDLGLRCGEAALLTVGSVNLKERSITFYRPKVDKVQTHTLPRDVLKALQAYFDAGDVPLSADAPLLRASRKSGQLTDAGMSERAITARVKALGAGIGIDRLSAHDCRHFWATQHARNGVDPFRLQEAGGWNSLAMPRRYIEEAQIANEGMGSV